ncbi:Hypp6836 [Branchiostoma lanceolatum]|uniref:Hypp6836 protein n=1 Tax=Branchiostoma lanceolatum TaxID=7740 RepID=A0A8J9YVI3_BRALA|nr:Hypp6836 [Branchiostoma lanceolatum]
MPLSTAGNRYVLVVSDIFSKYVNLYEIPRQDAATVADKLFRDFIGQHGVPDQLHSDQGPQYNSDLIAELSLQQQDFKQPALQQPDFKQPALQQQDFKQPALQQQDALQYHVFAYVIQDEPDQETWPADTLLPCFLPDSSVRAVIEMPASLLKESLPHPPGLGPDGPHQINRDPEAVGHTIPTAWVTARNRMTWRRVCRGATLPSGASGPDSVSECFFTALEAQPPTGWPMLRFTECETRCRCLPGANTCSLTLTMPEHTAIRILSQDEFNEAMEKAVISGWCVSRA